MSGLTSVATSRATPISMLVALLGGVASVALNLSKAFFAALGASVAVTNATFDNDIKAEVDGSTINAAGDVNMTARDDHKSDETVVSAALSSSLGVSVNSTATKENISEILKKRYIAMVNYNNSLKKGVFANVVNNSTIDAGLKIVGYTRVFSYNTNRAQTGQWH